MENTKHNIVGTGPVSNRHNAEIGKTDTYNTQIYGRWLSWSGTFTSLKSVEVKLVLLAQTNLPS